MIDTFTYVATFEIHPPADTRHKDFLIQSLAPNLHDLKKQYPHAVIIASIRDKVQLFNIREDRYRRHVKELENIFAKNMPDIHEELKPFGIRYEERSNLRDEKAYALAASTQGGTAKLVRRLYLSASVKFREEAKREKVIPVIRQFAGDLKVALEQELMPLRFDLMNYTKSYVKTDVQLYASSAENAIHH